MNTAFTQADLRAMCAACLRKDALPSDWLALAEVGDVALEIAQAEGVIGLLYTAVTNALEANADLSGLHKALSKRIQAEAACDLLRNANARQALDILDVGGLRSLVLKGAALAHGLYSATWQRVGCDVDVLVSDLGAAEVAVSRLQERGFALPTSVRPTRVAGYEVALERQAVHGFAIDLHWRLTNHESTARALEFGELWAASIALPSLHPTARGLGAVHALVHALLHRIANYPGGTHDRLIWLYDIHLLIQSLDPIQRETFLKLCEDRRIATPCLDGLVACASAFRTPIPEAMLTTLREQTHAEPWSLDSWLDRASMDRAHLVALTWRGKLHWLRYKLFPSPDFMRYRYRIDGASSLSLAYGKRLWIGLTRLFSRRR